MLQLIRQMTVVVLLGLPACAQDITGDWKGTLKLGGEADLYGGGLRVRLL